jgi:hypothetical protein
MESILDRIKKIAINEGITITSLENKIGASKGVLSRAIANGTDIQCKWIQIIVENYPQYSTEWLITGKGSMLKSKSGISDINIDYIKEYLKSKDRIDGLQQEIIKLQAQLLELTKKRELQE